MRSAKQSAHELLLIAIELALAEDVVRLMMTKNWVLKEFYCATLSNIPL